MVISSGHILSYRKGPHCSNNNGNGNGNVVLINDSQKLKFIVLTYVCRNLNGRVPEDRAHILDRLQLFQRLLRPWLLPNYQCATNNGRILLISTGSRGSRAEIQGNRERFNWKKNYRRSSSDFF